MCYNNRFLKATDISCYSDVFFFLFFFFRRVPFPRPILRLSLFSHSILAGAQPGMRNGMTDRENPSNLWFLLAESFLTPGLVVTHYLSPPGLFHLDIPQPPWNWWHQRWCHHPPFDAESIRGICPWKGQTPAVGGISGINGGVTFEATCCRFQ